MKKLGLAIMMLAFSVGADAACTRKDLTGNWVAYSSGAYSLAQRCKLTIPSVGNSIAADCMNANGVSNSAIVTITKFDSTCHFFAQYEAENDTIVIDSYVSKGKDSMAGMWAEVINSQTYSGSFGASKQ